MSLLLKDIPMKSLSFGMFKGKYFNGMHTGKI